MRKNISVTNERVLAAMEKSENASKLIEIAMIHYLDSLEIDHVSRFEFEELDRKVDILNENYTQTIKTLSMIADYMETN